jgi:uncharacterized protein (TIGR03032 family)
MTKPPAPFSCTYSPALPELLQQLDCSILVSTYQAGKLVAISAKTNAQLTQLPRTFQTAMAVGLHGNYMAVACRDEVVVLQNDRDLARTYPKKPDTYDALYTPRASYWCGLLDIHGLEWGTDGLWAVNTTFSCLSLISDGFSFTPKWMPPFIHTLEPGDKCHLNGMVMNDGKPAIVTAFGVTDKPGGWRDIPLGSGIAIDVESGEIICSELSMPHSPLLVNGDLYLLLSASGELVRINQDSGKPEVIKKIPGFLRGMAVSGDYLFIGRSRIRQNSSFFKELPIAKEAVTSGITVMHLPTAAIVGELTYQASVDEIYDVKILPGVQRPNILNTIDEIYKRALIIPGTSYWGSEKE